MPRVRGLVRRVALAALAEGIREEKLEVALKAARKYDPLLRGNALARIRRSVSLARTSTGIEDLPHLMRVAYFGIAGVVPESDFADTAAIAEEQSRLQAAQAAPRSGMRLTLAALVVVLVAVAVAVLLPRFVRPFDPRTSAAGRVLAEVIPELVVASRQEGSEEVERLRAAVGRRATRRALGDEAVETLDGLVDATLAVTGVPADGQGRSRRDRFASAARDFNAALEQRRLPYFVDSILLVDGGTYAPLLLSFYVQREVVVHVGEREIRTLHLWRLDELNVVHGALGFTRPSTPAALVLLDEIETDLVRYVLPALPEGERLQLVDDETDLEQLPWVDALGTQGRQWMQRYVSSLPPESRDGLDEVGRLLARRRALLAMWRGYVPSLHVPRRLIPETDFEQELLRRVPHEQLYEWNELHAELRRGRVLAAFERFRDRYAASVQRHELQHRLDFDRGLIPVPPIVCDMLRVDNPLGVAPDSLPGRVRDELAAYLASIAQAPDSPLLDLVLASRPLLDKHSGGIYWYAALAILDGMAQNLGIDAHAITGRSVRRDEAARLLSAIAARDDAALRKAAVDTYREQFGRDLELLEETQRVDRAAWRH